MSVHKTVIVLASLLWGLVSACEEQAMPKLSEPQKPIHVITVSVEKGAREDFFGQLRKFADKLSFSIQIGAVHPSGEHYVAEMLRKDLKIIALNSFDPATFKIAFYKESEPFLSADQLDALIADLKKSLSEVKGVIFPPSSSAPPAR